MRYLQAVVESETQKRLFKKDFQVQKIFEVFTDLWAHSLINTGLLRKEDVYNAFVVPRYGKFEMLSFPAMPSGYIYEKTVKITLDYQESCKPDVPVEFFSVGVWVPIFPKPYWANVQTNNFGFFWKNLDEALIQAHIATPTTQFHHKLYARDDEHANFLQEERAIANEQKEHTPLVEIVPVEDTSPD